MDVRLRTGAQSQPRKYCSGACLAATRTPEAYSLAHTPQGLPFDACREWLRWFDPKGYGRFQAARKIHLAHRYAQWPLTAWADSDIYLEPPERWLAPVPQWAVELLKRVGSTEPSDFEAQLDRRAPRAAGPQRGWRAGAGSTCRSPVDPAADLAALLHWAWCLNELATILPVIERTRLIPGSAGQLALNQLAQYVQQLRGAIEHTEIEFGMTPLSRSRLGATIGEAKLTSLVL
jgi:hypothetical protein